MPELIPTDAPPARTPRRVPSMPWIEVLGFLAMIALLAAQGA